MSLAAVLCRAQTGIILHEGNLCEELAAIQLQYWNVHETVGIQRAGLGQRGDPPAMSVLRRSVWGQNCDEPLLAAASMVSHRTPYGGMKGVTEA